MLIIFGGLPGTGKTTVAKQLSEKLKAVYLRIDSIEQGIRDAFPYNPDGNQKVIAEGYMAAYAVAKDNLRIGHIVIADSVNPIEITREAWREVAISLNKPFIEVELICSDKNIHQARVESRQSDIKGLTPPTWQEVIKRDYQPWQSPDIKIDSALITASDAVSMIVEKLPT